MKPLEEETRREVVRATLSVHGKKLDDVQMDMVVKKPQTANPLFLRTILDEARFFGNFFMLTQYLESLLKSQNTMELYGKVLDRLAGNFFVLFYKLTYRNKNVLFFYLQLLLFYSSAV